MKRRTSDPINIAALSDRDFRAKYADRVRTGKTQKDKNSGAHAARTTNRDARVQWQQDNRATNATFPGAVNA